MTTISYAAAIRKQFTELDIQKVPYRPSALLNMLRKTDQQQLSIEWRANVGGGAVGGRAVTADVATANDAADSLQKATLAIGDHVVGHKFSLNRDKLTEAARIGEGAVQDLVGMHIEMAYELILNGLSLLCYNGTGNAASRGVFGLDQAFDAAAYAGIAKATYPKWAAYMDANGGTARALTRGMFEKIDVHMQKEGVLYDTIVTTPEIVKKYTSLFSTDRGYNVVGGSRPQADIGYTGASYNLVPILADPQCPTGTMYFFNSRGIELKTFKGTDTVVEDRLVKAVTNGESTFGMNWMISEIPNRNPDNIEIEIAVKPQLWIKQPKFVAVVRDVIQTL
jgi:hypothetical protein